GGLRRVGATPSAHPALHASYEREGRALHPDHAAPVGLPLRLPVQRPPCARPLGLAAVVQQASTPRLARRPPTRQPCLTPLWSVQLAAVGGPSCFGLLDEIMRTTAQGTGEAHYRIERGALPSIFELPHVIRAQPR